MTAQCKSIASAVQPEWLSKDHWVSVIQSARMCVLIREVLRGDCLKQAENHHYAVHVYKLIKRVTVMKSYFELFLFAASCFSYFPL